MNAGETILWEGQFIPIVRCPHVTSHQFFLLDLPTYWKCPLCLEEEGDQ